MRLLIACSAFFISVSLFAQGGHSRRFEVLQSPDSFYFKIQCQTSNIKYSEIETSTEIDYDPINQFPYYSLNLAAEQMDSIWINFELLRMPSKGHLMIYYLDNMNTPFFLSVLSPDSLSGAAKSHWKWQIPLQKGSVQYFVAMLSTKPFENPPLLVSSLEMTLGSFLFRQKNVFGNGMVPPEPLWRLLPGNYPGAEWEKGFFDTENFAYLPVLFFISCL